MEIHGCKDRNTRLKNFFIYDETLGFGLDVSCMNPDPAPAADVKERLGAALSKMNELECGALSNPDEKRMVGHYWLRNSALAPTPQIKDEIEQNLKQIKDFAGRIHSGKIKPQKGDRFKYLLSVGIGGSALGPQFLSDCLTSSSDRMKVFFIDNTDPDGISRTLKSIPDLSKTLTLVISKSGGTKETKNGMLEAKAAYASAGLEFSRHAAAVTGKESRLDQIAVRDGWLARFPMWDWVGGRTSVCSAVGLLPMALQGIDIDLFLKGAGEMDTLTRGKDPLKNPAALMALAWYTAGGGKGDKNMVVVPYKDRLLLFSRYLQQLVMESLGKEKDLDGRIVNQGLSVFGNKGSTDQHAYIQQLRDGRNDFFVTFIEILRDFYENDKPSEVLTFKDGFTSGDYLFGFLHGTRKALAEKGRQSLTITLKTLSPYSTGVLIALFERTVGLYANLVNINAYHQPGVEAGKKAAAAVLELQEKVVDFLKSEGSGFTAEEIAARIKEESQLGTVFKILLRLEANGRLQAEDGSSVFNCRFSIRE